MAGALHGPGGGKFVDLGTAYLERALRRMREDDDAGAVADLRSALRHMLCVGADPAQTKHLAAVIAGAERAARAAQPAGLRPGAVS